MATRIEHDLLGALEVPADALYGIHTHRAVQNFQLTGQPIHPELVRALALVKKACAAANHRIGLLPDPIAQAIDAACDEVSRGEHAEAFVTDALQGGAGTSMNLNACEVIANLAIERLGGCRGDYSIVHPLDHVNLSQSTNDVVPTALRLAAIALVRAAAQAMAELQAELQKKEKEFAGVIKLGRTELMDAVPITLGQEFSAWAQAAQRDWWRLYKSEERLRQVNLGGTAVGTGLNADRAYVFSVVDILRDMTGIGFARAENLIDATQNLDVIVEVSGMVKAAAVNLAKISADLRLLASGPRAGLAEIRLPELQAGSSIMPGKVNPVATEAVSQMAFQIMAADQAITMAAASGQLELNAFVPLVAHNLLHALSGLAQATRLLAHKCVAGITADVERCRDLLEQSYGLVTALSPYLGYEDASAVVREAQAKGQTIREVVRARGVLGDEELARILDPREMTRPGIAGLGTDDERKK
jgi:aspartate ammonia-lyase